MKCGLNAPVNLAKITWDGTGYHRVATVQESWGIRVLESIPPGEYPKILDAGCGTGRLTAHLLRRFPRARLVGLDRSAEMLKQAERTLSRFRDRLKLVQGDLLTARPGKDFNLIFSNATFHWVLDHRALFRNLYACLAPEGLLVAQCGGRGNIRRVETMVSLLSKMDTYELYFRKFQRPVHYASAASTAKLLRESGFRDVHTWLHPAPTRFPSRATFRDFISHVIFIPNLSCLPTAKLKSAYIEAFLDLYEKKFGKLYMLDYVRLNIRAQR